jgi:BarA-like signal transduction histidine kinase
VSKPRAPAHQFAEFFQWHAILPTSLHEALQEAAKKEGWTPPWDCEEQAAAEQLKKRTAGKKSGLARAGRASLRLPFVKEAFGRLKPAHRMQPFSEHSMRALQVKYREVIAEGDDPATSYDAELLMAAAPFKADRDTLKRDLILLGIRSKRRKRRSG